MKRYRVRYLTEATEALRDAFLHVREDAGPRTATNWLRRVYASIDQKAVATCRRPPAPRGKWRGRGPASALPIENKRTGRAARTENTRTSVEGG